MNKNLQSPTSLTEFAPLSPEHDDSQGITYLFSKLFKRSANTDPTLAQSVPSKDGATTPQSSTSVDSRWLEKSETVKDISQPEQKNPLDTLRLESEGRSLPNVLRRISNLLALKSSGLQSYKDTELKQYWMPDSVSKECYDCGEKFTTFRRKHHCRVCGQIFCSRCCNQEIPGKIMGCTGDLRVCTYCGKVVLSYLQSADMGADLSSDLRALQEDLQTKFGGSTGEPPPAPATAQPSLSVPSTERDDARRKTSVGYQEEKFIQARPYQRDERRSPLHRLAQELSQPTGGLGYGTVTATQLVDWLMLQNKASLRSQAVAIGQALLDTGYLEPINSDNTVFADKALLFRLVGPPSPVRTPPPPPSSDEIWLTDPPLECTTTDSESECPASDSRLQPSSSLFRLDLNLEDSTVHVSRPYPQPTPPPHTNRQIKLTDEVGEEKELGEGTLGDTVVRAVAQWFREGSRDPGKTVDWQAVSPQMLREDNGERQAYTALSGVFQQHLAGLVKQLLTSEGLAQSWAETVLPLAQRVVDTIRPDLRSDTEDMDIRHYVQLKKVSGGCRSDSCIVGGVVCRKNLAHRAMPTRLSNPRILLLSCAIVYQRIEGRLMSLEPVMMQEQEYLRHTVARIAAMGPDLVLVQRNVSRLAQESLLRLGISLVLNVKPSVLERVARVTGADLVHSIDAQVGRPQLGHCAEFYIKSFTSETGATKTLMLLEGCPAPQLGCTVLLRGAPTAELARVKSVTSWLIYALYNWRLEFSFLMDEFALPPSLPDDFFKDDVSNGELKSPQSWNKTKSGGENRSGSEVNSKASDGENKCVELINADAKHIKIVIENKNSSKLSTKDKSVSDERRINVESVSDFSDPLHLYLNLDDEVFNDGNNGQSFSVSEPHQSSRFKNALDDTLLSVSPFLKFSVPYLETESGRNCLLRSYLPQQIYWTAQLQDNALTNRLATTEPTHKGALLKLNGVKLSPVHPFVTAKLTEPADSHNVQTMLALFRAQGGRLPMPPLHRPSAQLPAPPPAAPTPPVDSLDPAKHQRLAVLFCSYSHESPNAPAFCVNPWIVHMDYYGCNDIALGAFLERYCFRSTYVCPSERCSTPMVRHVRRFVHDGGSIQISLREIEGAPDTGDDAILMWSYCPACNQQVSQVTRMSPDTWMFSFAKFLELHFHAGVYSMRGSDCPHSLHHTCRRLFGHNNMVAYFQFDKISVWEVSLPPQVLVTQAVPRSDHQDAILEEVKRWALSGYELFSAVLNRLCTLASHGESGAMVMKQQLQKEQSVFKSRVEEIQMRLTSPTHLNSQEPTFTSTWHLEDSLVLLKRSIAEAVAEWNGRLSDAEATYLRRRDDKRRFTPDNRTLSTSSGLTEIVDGVHPDSQPVAPGSDSESLKVLPSQLSQISLHSAVDVMDVEDTLAVESIFNLEKDAVVVQTNLSDLTEDTTVKAAELSASEEIHEQTPFDHESHHVEEDAVVQSQSSKQQLSERVSVKQILSQLLPKDTPVQPLQCPLSPQEHHTLPLGSSVPVVVYEREPSSIIAYALSCHDYRAGLDDLRAKRASISDQSAPSPLLKRKSGSMETKETTVDPGDPRKTGVLSLFRQTSSNGNVSQIVGPGGVVASAVLDPEESAKPLDSEPIKTKGKDKNSSHLEVQFSDSTANFMVKIYYVEEFARLRAAIFPAGEEAFVRSLSRCVQWAARGGKSGSNFAKTKDDRFILKEMSRTETLPFMESAPQYFEYTGRCAAAGSPTLLGKIVGVYRVIHRSTSSNATFRSNLLVMENLFHGRSVRHKFDLKGSVRNRLVNPLDQGGEIVLLDENLINMTCDSPLYILPHSKTVLMQAIQSDTQFLASQSVMDYSLLVGLDETNKELVVGIIDYIRTFTWDKKLETIVKKSGLLGGQGKLPTIVSPEEYRDRFIAAMHRYFLPVPDRWSGLGKGIDF